MKIFDIPYVTYFKLEDVERAINSLNGVTLPNKTKRFEITFSYVN